MDQGAASATGQAKEIKQPQDGFEGVIDGQEHDRQDQPGRDISRSALS